MPCKICERKPVWKFTNQQQLCSKCFAEYFEKKVRLTIRKYNMPTSISKGSNLKEKIINSITRKLPKREGKISPDNLNFISVKILYIMMNENKDKLKALLPKNQPLYSLSDKEILLYAKIKGIKGKLNKMKNERRIKDIDDFIKIIEEKNPDIRNNIVSAILKLKY